MARAPRFLTENWHLKLAALGLSLFLWALVQTEPLSQETFSAVPVAVAVADTSWTISGAPSPATVELRLGGPAREIIRLAREGTSIRVPVASVSARDTVISLQREWVQLGQRPGVTVESVSPATISLSFEPAASRSIPLGLRVRGELPERFALSSEVAFSPQTVTVRGPESRLRGLDSLYLEPLDLEDVRESGVIRLSVDTTGLGGASVVPAEAVLGVRLEPREERVLEGIVVHAEVRADEPEVVVEPEAIQLRLAGARTLVTSMDLSLLQVFVAPESLRDMQPGEVRVVRPQIEGLPPLITAYPSVETVTVRSAADPPENEESDRP
ncbi:MAG TPA: YbbR-like domain-containing protein [Longimicrobiales bacterium]|nr:YbbR-like domain-containing protein [Longimicrobiales bacterium]